MGSRAGFRPPVSRVTPGYLAGAGVRFIAGRDGTGDERGIVVNRTLAPAWRAAKVDPVVALGSEP